MILVFSLIVFPKASHPHSLITFLFDWSLFWLMNQLLHLFMCCQADPPLCSPCWSASCHWGHKAEWRIYRNGRRWGPAFTLPFVSTVRCGCLLEGPSDKYIFHNWLTTQQCCLINQQISAGRMNGHDQRLKPTENRNLVHFTQFLLITFLKIDFCNIINKYFLILWMTHF